MFPSRLSLLARLALMAALLAPAASARALDVNLADAAQLAHLKGLGPATAERIVRERERGGPYQSPQDLAERVRGIGARKLQGLQEAGLTVGPASAAPAPREPARAANRPGTRPATPARRP